MHHLLHLLQLFLRVLGPVFYFWGALVAVLDLLGGLSRGTGICLHFPHDECAVIPDLAHDCLEFLQLPGLLFQQQPQLLVRSFKFMAVLCQLIEPGSMLVFLDVPHSCSLHRSIHQVDMLRLQ